MSNKQISNYGILLILLLSIVNLVNATTIIPYSAINSTQITSLGLNLTLNCTNQIYFGAIIESNSIYIENIGSTLNSVERLSYNITESNKYYLCSDLPIIVSSSDTSKTIDSGLTNPISVIAEITSGQINQVGKVTVSNGQTFRFPGSTTNPLELNLINLTNGDTTLTIENTKQIASICEQGGFTFLDAISLVGIILTLILISVVFAVLLGSFAGFIDINPDHLRQKLDFKVILISIMTILLTGLLLVTVAFVFNGAYCSAIGG